MTKCLAPDCASNDPVKGCVISRLNEYLPPIACEYGRFVTNILDKFGHLGEWKFKSIGHYSNVLVATLKGTYGRIEVWGGSTHRTEVWVIAKDGGKHIVSTNPSFDALESACMRVGIPYRQTRLELGA